MDDGHLKKTPITASIMDRENWLRFLLDADICLKNAEQYADMFLNSNTKVEEICHFEYEYFESLRLNCAGDVLKILRKLGKKPKLEFLDTAKKNVVKSSMCQFFKEVKERAKNSLSALMDDVMKEVEESPEELKYF